MENNTVSILRAGKLIGMLAFKISCCSFGGSTWITSLTSSSVVFIFLDLRYS